MSEYVVHLTKSPGARDAFYTIVGTGIIQATSRSGIARDSDLVSQLAACFSEIPVTMISRLADRYSPYGVGFHQDTLVRQRGARVWYVELDSGLAGSLVLLRDDHAARCDPGDSFWDIAPFIERPGTYGNGAVYRFEWEREWRVAREDMWFAAREIVFVFAPEEEHQVLATWLAETPVGTSRQVASPLILDPRWADDRLFSAFAAHLAGR